MVSELAEENKILYNQTPVNTLIEDMEKLKNGFLTKKCFTPGDNEKIDTNRFFKDSKEIAKFIDKILDKYDDHRSEYYTGNIRWYFRNFRSATRSNHGGGSNDLNNIQEYKGSNFYEPSGNRCSLKYNNYISKKVLAWSILNSFNRVKEKQML